MPTPTSTASDLALRPATLDDAAFVADVWTAARPDEPVDPVLQRYYWEHPHDEGVWARYIAFLDDRPVGVSAQDHVRRWEEMPERYARLQAELIPAARSADRLAALLAFGEAGAGRDGALRATTWAWEDDTLKLAAARLRGFREERRERFWELDIPANRGRIEEMAESSRKRMREQGIALSTLAADPDPDRYRKLWSMSNEAEMDVPTTVPHTRQSFDAFAAALGSPGLREDRIWIARRGDDVVGVSMLEYPPVRGHVRTDWTATARSARGMGIARALKCETVLQAAALGVTSVRTDNDSQNKPILHINETMGYRVVGEMIQLHKEL